MDILQLYQDHSVNYLTEGHKHCREGWVNTPCPFCTGNAGYHLGYNIEGDFYTCFRCGWHPVYITISKLTGVNEAEAKRLIKQYGYLIRPKKDSVTITKVVDHKFPSGVGAMGIMHRIYLDKRGFDPEQLEKEWKLLGTGPVSMLDGIDYKFRIIIPFIWNDLQVSFDSRDITGKDPGRYRACPKERELIPHKDILYGRQDKWKETGICVEGPTDVWRLGTNAFAVSGIKYTQKQVREMAKAFKRIFVLFDDDPQAVVQAHKLVAELRFRGVEAIYFESIIAPDPGSMKQSDADYLVKQLIK